jgi:hypothetical protein
MTTIELKEKTTIDSEIHLIAECNVYNENNEMIRQCSRSPFVFPDTMTDAEIIESLQLNEYSIYF